MKKIVFILATTVLVAGTVLVSCQNTTKKEEAAQENLSDAQEDLMDAQNKVDVATQKAATAEEWQAFKDKTEATINKNETRIAELKVKMKNTEKSVDAMYAKNIAVLDQKNKDLKVRITTYKNDAKSDWESFKREFDYDMYELGQAIKDLTIDVPANMLLYEIEFESEAGADGILTVSLHPFFCNAQTAPIPSG